MSFNFGDYVAYDPGYLDKPEIGRVKRDAGETVFVCYHSGCTASASPACYVRPATEQEIAEAPKDLGHHRFDTWCPNRIEDCCYDCGAKKLYEGEFVSNPVEDFYKFLKGLHLCETLTNNSVDISCEGFSCHNCPLNDENAFIVAKGFVEELLSQERIKIVE